MAPRTLLRGMYCSLMVALVGVYAVAPHSARAQAPSGADRLSQSAIADSLAVIARMDSLVRSNRNDAASWFRLGMAAWSLYERARNEPRPPNLDWTRLGRMADTSLRLAAQIEPENPFYRLMAGRFLLTTGTSIARAASYGFFDAALEAARKSGNAFLLSETAVEAGRVHWREYDALADRWMITGAGEYCTPFVGMIRVGAVKTTADTGLFRRDGARIMRDRLLECGQPLLDPPSGQDDYLRAEALFREAFEADPTNQRAYRQFAMLLVERNRWAELAFHARARLQRVPWDPWAYLTLGLAIHRQHGEARLAAAAFDSALTYFSDEDRQRFARLERVLGTRDSLRFAALDPQVRLAMSRTYWISAVPLWSRPMDLPQMEFLSRVTHAELRWTVDELKVRGAETDRGDVFIRYGPPDLVASFRGQTEITTMWVYNTGLVFSFTGQPTFATAQIAPEDLPAFDEVVRAAPVLWHNIREALVIDSMPVQIARFRARDSVDVVIAALPPVDAITRASETVGSVRSDFWMLLGGTTLTAHDSVLPARQGVQTFTRRVAPGSYLLRVEATSPNSSRAARSSTTVGADSASNFRLHGFGMSDVVVATSVNERPAPGRWSDLDIKPALAPVPRNETMTLVWENYDFAQSDGSARYDVSITLRRMTAGTGVVGARVLGSLARSVGVARAADHVTLQFERSVPYSPVMVDNIALSLEPTPPGLYEVTVAITDKVSGARTTRTTSLVVGEPVRR
jgi:GWxTD domain-containing protein